MACICICNCIYIYILYICIKYYSQLNLERKCVSTCSFTQFMHHILRGMCREEHFEVWSAVKQLSPVVLGGFKSLKVTLQIHTWTSTLILTLEVTVNLLKELCLMQGMFLLGKTLGLHRSLMGVCLKMGMPMYTLGFSAFPNTFS